LCYSNAGEDCCGLKHKLKCEYCGKQGIHKKCSFFLKVNLGQAAKNNKGAANKRKDDPKEKR